MTTSPWRSDPITRTLLLLTLVMLLVTVWVVRPLVWPTIALDNPSPQVVLSRVAGYAGPATSLDDGDVHVTGEKCNVLREPVVVAGTVTWVSQSPDGSSVVTGGGVREREPGCDTFDFKNPIPDAVRVRTMELASEARTAYVEWRIVGAEEVVSPERNFAKAAWYTEPFRVYVEPPETAATRSSGWLPETLLRGVSGWATEYKYATR